MTPEELGYKKVEESVYCKDMATNKVGYKERHRKLYLWLKSNNKYQGKVVFDTYWVDSQKDIDIVQILFNNLQKDLKILNGE